MGSKARLYYIRQFKDQAVAAHTLAHLAEQDGWPETAKKLESISNQYKALADKFSDTGHNEKR